ncbi:hypothetical protein MC885_005343, partial [Smutsia gigantea]
GRGGPGALANRSAKAWGTVQSEPGAGVLSRVEVALSPRAPRTHLSRTVSGVLSALLSPAGAVGRTPEGPGAALQDDYCIQVQINGSSPQWDNLESGVYSEKKIVRFTSNDSMSVFQENQKIRNMGDEPQTEERHLRITYTSEF